MKTQAAKKQYIWQKKTLKEVDTNYDGQFSAPPNTIPTPYKYFRKFIDDACIENIALQTSIYAIQKGGKAINVTKAEVEQFFGILTYTGVYKAASYRMYWETCSRVSLIADVMSRNRFETILRYIHFNDNTMMKKRMMKDLLDLLLGLVCDIFSCCLLVTNNSCNTLHHTENFFIGRHEEKLNA